MINFNDKFGLLDEFPAIGFRYFLREPMLNNSINICEHFAYFVKSDKSPNYSGDGLYPISFNSKINVVRSYSLRDPNSFFSRFRSNIFDEFIGAKIQVYDKIKTVDLLN